jgi:4-carboxymuconolactone decarboxylase
MTPTAAQNPSPAGEPRMPPLATHEMNAAQQAAAAELAAGPRKGVKGPFIALLRSPELMARLQKVGEFLRFQSSLSRRANEFATLIVSRAWTQQFEWAVHVPLALEAGTPQATIDALRDGRRPDGLSDEEQTVYDFTTELMHNRGVCARTYREAVDRLGEAGVVELTSLVGYFVMVSMVLNVAHTPAGADAGAQPLPAFPL